MDGRRRSARVILLDGRANVLLLRFRDAVAADPEKPWLLEYWVTPGGGLEPGEDWPDAAGRELFEETGIEAVIGPWVVSRTVRLVIGGRTRWCDERYYLARADRTMVETRHRTAVEHAVCRAHRWWPIEALRDADLPVMPPGLPGLLERLVAGELPRPPVVLGDANAA